MREQITIESLQELRSFAIAKAASTRTEKYQFIYSAGMNDASYLLRAGGSAMSWYGCGRINLSKKLADELFKRWPAKSHDAWKTVQDPRGVCTIPSIFRLLLTKESERVKFEADVTRTQQQALDDERTMMQNRAKAHVRRAIDMLLKELEGGDQHFLAMAGVELHALVLEAHRVASKLPEVK